MKSFINKLADYRETPFEKNVTICCPEEHIQAQMKHLTRGYKKTELVETLEKGVVAVLSLESASEKFNRPSVFVTVGGGLFDAEFEEKLIGHSVGEEFEVIHNDMTVKVNVKQASRTVFPEPTDEMAAAYAGEHEEFSGITTVEGYREHIINTYLEDKRKQTVFGAMDEVLNYVLTHSDWEFDEDEISELVSEVMKFIRNELKEETDREFDELTDEELKSRFGVDSRKELDKFIHDEAEQRIATVLWLADIEGVDVKESSIEELEETQNWGFLENFVKENLSIKEER